MKWVTIKKAAELSGYTEKAIEAKRADGTFLEGKVWRKTPDSKVEISVDGFDEWVEGRVARGIPLPKETAMPRRNITNQLRARPPWADRSAIAWFYDLARELTRNTGVRHSVDHCIPLNHPLVCGLHVENNLAVITLSDNCRKSNRWAA